MEDGYYLIQITGFDQGVTRNDHVYTTMKYRIISGKHIGYFNQVRFYQTRKAKWLQDNAARAFGLSPDSFGVSVLEMKTCIAHIKNNKSNDQFEVVNFYNGNDQYARRKYYVTRLKERTVVETE